MADPTLVQNAEALALEVAEEINRVREEIVAAGSIDATLDALSDVDVSTVPPTDRQALVFDFATGVWMPGSVAAGGGGGGGTGVTSVVYYDDQTSTYPARPTTDDAIIWHGPVDPGAPMLNGDTWIDTSSGDPSPGGYIVYANGAYPARADQQPVTFVGPVSPFDLGRMINGDTWINTTTATVTNAVYLSSADLAPNTLALLQDTTSPVYLAVKALADAAGVAAKPKEVRFNVQTGQSSVDEFETGLYPDVAWTRVDPSNPERVTWRQGGGALGFTHTGGDAAALLHAYLRPGALAVGEAFETCARMLVGWNQSSSMIGLMVATAASATQYMLAANLWTDNAVSGAYNIGLRQHTNLNTSGGADGAALSPWGGNRIMPLQTHYMRIARTGTNQWDTQFSADGINWITTHRLTPARLGDTYTHVGFYCASWASTSSFAGSFDYLRKVVL